MSVDSKGQANFQCGFCGKLYKVQAIADDADINLFGKMANHRHCVHTLLHPIKSCNHYLRPKEHIYELPRCERHKKSFVRYHVFFISTRNVFYSFYVRFYHCTACTVYFHRLHVRLFRVLLNINQSISQRPRSCYRCGDPVRPRPRV